MPQPIKFTTQEGGKWIAWEDRRQFNLAPTGVVAHAIAFDDGSIFDCLNGWRNMPSDWRANLEAKGLI